MAMYLLLQNQISNKN